MKHRESGRTTTGGQGNRRGGSRGLYGESWRKGTSLARLYLTPRLDRYVDFHRTCVLAWRHEANSARQDMVTVWLRRTTTGTRPITYRAIEEAVIGAAPAAYLGGELLDDALSQPTSAELGGGSGAGATVGNKYWTGAACGG